jgi:hypothetical protein
MKLQRFEITYTITPSRPSYGEKPDKVCLDALDIHDAIDYAEKYKKALLDLEDKEEAEVHMVINKGKAEATVELMKKCAKFLKGE